MSDPMTLDETIATAESYVDHDDRFPSSVVHWLTTLKAERSALERRCSTLGAAGMLLRNEHTKLRKQLAQLVDEVTHVISGGDDPSDKCTECGCAGIGMLRDARTDSLALLKETEPAE